MNEYSLAKVQKYYLYMLIFSHKRRDIIIDIPSFIEIFI